MMLPTRKTIPKRGPKTIIKKNLLEIRMILQIVKLPQETKKKDDQPAQEIRI